MHNAALFKKRGLQNRFSFLLGDSTLLKPGAGWPALDHFSAKWQFYRLFCKVKFRNWVFEKAGYHEGYILQSEVQKLSFRGSRRAQAPAQAMLKHAQAILNQRIAWACLSMAWAGAWAWLAHVLPKNQVSNTQFRTKWTSEHTFCLKTKSASSTFWE